MRPHRAVPVVVLAGLFALAGCGGGGHARPTPAPKPSASPARWFAACPTPTGPARGAGLPDVAVPCFTGGRPVRLDRAYGRPTIVNLWASWCPPCRQELPEIARYAKAHPDVLVLTVDTGDRRSAGEAFARDAGVRLPTLFDADRRVLDGVGRSALPVTLLVDAHGTVAYTYNATALTARTLDALVRRHLPGAR